MLVTWTPNPNFVKCLGALCFHAFRGLGVMPNFRNYYFVLWRNKILLYLQPLDFSSALWGFTEESTWFSPGEYFRGVKLVILSPRFCFCLEKRALDSSRAEGNAESLCVYSCPLKTTAMAQGTLFLLTRYLYSYSYLVGDGLWVVMGYLAGGSLTWNTWEPTWMKARLELCAMR